MAAPSSWDFAVPQRVHDDSERWDAPRIAEAPQRVRVVTWLRRGLFADAISNVMEQEGFDVVTAHDRDAMIELAGSAGGCILEMALDDSTDALIEVTQRYGDLRVVVLANANTTHAARAVARTTPRVHVTSGDSLDRVLGILRGEDAAFERRKGSGRPHANGTSSDRDPRQLTAREVEILEGLLDGENTKVLAARLGVSQATARTHVQSVLSKLGVHSRLEAVALVNSGMREPLAGVRFGNAARA